MRVPLAVLRLAVAALVIVAVVATFLTVGASTRVNPANFFGFFTIQSNLIDAVVLTIGAIRLLRGTPVSVGFTVVRWATTDFIVLVGIVYAVLLAPLGAAGGVPLPWANTVVHVVTPIFGALDWLLATDRARFPLRLIWLPIVYPAVWIVVVLIRGATDGWVPYPFLDPANGYAFVAGMVALITVAVVGFALVLRVLGRRPPIGAGSPRGG